MASGLQKMIPAFCFLSIPGSPDEKNIIPSKTHKKKHTLDNTRYIFSYGKLCLDSSIRTHPFHQKGNFETIHLTLTTRGPRSFGPQHGSSNRCHNTHGYKCCLKKKETPTNSKFKHQLNQKMQDF